MTQDITPYYQEIERRVLHLLLLCGLIWAVTGAGVFALVHRALKPLRRLTKAAGSIGEGNLDERVPVESQDEIGEFATVFNRRTEQVEAQVEDLQLLLGALAHEIKTPMTAVIGYSDSLLHVKLSGEDVYKRQGVGEGAFLQPRNVGDKWSGAGVDINLAAPQLLGSPIRVGDM